MERPARRVCVWGSRRESGSSGIPLLFSHTERIASESRLGWVGPASEHAGVGWAGRLRAGRGPGGAVGGADTGGLGHARAHTRTHTHTQGGGAAGAAAAPAGQRAGAARLRLS